jgi:hypothetical protein
MRKKHIISIIMVVMLLFVSSCNKEKESMIPEEAVEYGSLEEALQKTRIQIFRVPEHIDGYDEIRYFYYSDEVAIVEYIGEYNTLMLVGKASSCQQVLEWESKLHPNAENSQERYGRAVDVPDTKYSFNLRGYVSENKGEDLQYSIAYNMGNNFETYELYSKKPLEFDEICNLCTEIVLMNAR